MAAMLDHMMTPSQGMRAVVCANWGRRSWNEYEAVLLQYRKENLDE
jgi:hypothetical protein